MYSLNYLNDKGVYLAANELYYDNGEWMTKWTYLTNCLTYNGIMLIFIIQPMRWCDEPLHVSH